MASAEARPGAGTTKIKTRTHKIRTGMLLISLAKGGRRPRFDALQ
jgi:hypothetical protein